MVHIAGNVSYSFSGVDLQIVVQNKVNVMREKFFARGFFLNWFQTPFAHFYFVWRREHRAPHRVATNCVGNRPFLNDEVVQALLLRGFSGRKTRWSSSNDK